MIVVLVPSLGRGSDDFEDLAARLRARGHHVIAHDPRGINGAPGPLDDLTLHDYALDIAKVIEDAGAPVHVVGHAWGNRAVRCLAADRPDLVSTVTLLAAGGLVEMEPDILPALGRCFDLDRPTAEHLADVALVFFAPGNDASVWRGGWWPEAARAQSAAVRRTDVADWWDGGTAPLLVVQGLQDRCAVPANGRALAEAHPGRVQLIELDHAGHALLPEQPAAVAEAVIDFVEGFDRDRA